MANFSIFRKCTKCFGCRLKFVSGEAIKRVYTYNSSLTHDLNYSYSNPLNVGLYFWFRRYHYYHVKCWSEYKNIYYKLSLLMTLLIVAFIFIAAFIVMDFAGVFNSDVYLEDFTKVKTVQWKYYWLAGISLTIVELAIIGLFVFCCLVLQKRIKTMRAARLKERESLGDSLIN